MDKRQLWTTSGSESNESAMRIIRQYQLERGRPEKVKIISRKQSYHGYSLGAMSLSSGPRTDIYKAILLDQEKLCLKMPVCNPYRDQKENETLEEYTQRLLDFLENMIIENDPSTVSVVVVETLPGSSLGTIVPPPGYLPGIRALCNKHDIIFMLDEVMCGTGRCNPNGKLNCWENFLTAEQAPDIQTVGKTLGSGYVTIAGVLIGPKIKRAVISGTGLTTCSNTYASHGFNCAVALGIQRKILREGLTSNIFEMGNLLGKILTERLLGDEKTIVGDVRGIGGFWSIEFVKDRNSKEPFPPEVGVASRLYQLCFNNKLSVFALNKTIDSVNGDIAMFAPSFVITKTDVEDIVDLSLIHI